MTHSKTNLICKNILMVGLDILYATSSDPENKYRACIVK